MKAEPPIVTPELCAALGAREVSLALPILLCTNDHAHNPAGAGTGAMHMGALGTFSSFALPLIQLQVVGSNVGPTIAGVTPANLSQFAFELVRAVSTGALHPDKCAVAVKAAGIEASDQVAATIADMMW